jgi:ribosome-associated protein
MTDETPLPSGIEIAPGLYVPESWLRFSFARSGGPGGQNVNKVSSKARMAVSMGDLQTVLSRGTFERLSVQAASRITDAGELVITCEESRSQHANRATCLERLREILVEAKRVPRVRRATKPSKGARQRRLESKKQRGQVKRQRGAPGGDE